MNDPLTTIHYLGMAGIIAAACLVLIEVLTWRKDAKRRLAKRDAARATLDLWLDPEVMAAIVAMQEEGEL